MDYLRFKQVFPIIALFILACYAIPFSYARHNSLAVPGESQITAEDDPLSSLLKALKAEHALYVEITQESMPDESTQSRSARDFAHTAWVNYKLGFLRMATKYFYKAADAYYAIGNNKETIRFGKILLTLDLKLDKRDDFIFMDLSLIANAYFNLHQYEESLKYILPPIEGNRELLSALLDQNKKYGGVAFYIVERGRHLTMDLSMAARSHRHLEQYQEAEELVMENIRINRELLSMAENMQEDDTALTLKEHLFGDYIFASEIFSLQRNFSRFHEYHEKSDLLYQELVDRTVDTQEHEKVRHYMTRHALMLSLRAKAHFLEDDFVQAHTFILQAIELRKSMQEGKENDIIIEIRKHLEKDLFLAAQICYHMKKYAEAKEYILQTIEMIEEFKLLFSNNEHVCRYYTKQLAISFALLGNIHFMLREIDQSAVCLREAFDLNIELGEPDAAAKNMGLLGKNLASEGLFVMAALTTTDASELDYTRGDTLSHTKSSSLTALNWSIAASQPDISDELKKSYHLKAAEYFEKYAALCEQTGEIGAAAYGMFKASKEYLDAGKDETAATLIIKAAHLNQRAHNWEWEIKCYILGVRILDTVADANENDKTMCVRRAKELLEAGYQQMLESNDLVVDYKSYIMYLKTRYPDIFDESTISIIPQILSGTGIAKDIDAGSARRTTLGNRQTSDRSH